MRTSMTPSCLNCASLDRVFMEIIPCRPQHAVRERLIPTGTGFFSVSELTQYTTGHVCTCMLMKERGTLRKVLILYFAWVDTDMITVRGSQRSL